MSQDVITKKISDLCICKKYLENFLSINKKETYTQIYLIYQFARIALLL